MKEPQRIVSLVPSLSEALFALGLGAIIGTASAPIARGEHIHTHNLESDYLPTYTLEAGRAFVGKHA